MSFRLEMHLHTKESSACGTLSGAEQVDQFMANGYDGILVTDHFINGNSAVDRSLPWEEQMDQQFLGYENAYKHGKELGFRVFCGTEFAYHGTEFLVIGATKEWFKRNPEIAHMTPLQFIDKFKEAGFAVIQAHPYRRASYISKIRLFPEFVDAIEVYNANNDSNWNDSAYNLAVQYSKPMTGGSDSHNLGQIGGGIVLDKEPLDEKELISIIKSGMGFKVYGANYD